MSDDPLDIKPALYTTYECWPVSDSEKTARERFLKRHGYDAENCYEEYGMLWLGPVKDAPATLDMVVVR